MIIIVKIAGGAGLRVGQVGKNGPLPTLELFGFEAGPGAFRLGVVIAVPAAALRAHDPVLMQQGPIGVAAVLAALPGTTPIGVHDQLRGGWVGGWAKKARCKAVMTNYSGIVAATYQPNTCLLVTS